MILPFLGVLEDGLSVKRMMREGHGAFQVNAVFIRGVDYGRG